MKNKLLVIFLIAFLLRLINLDQSLWLDEAVVAKVARTIPLLQISYRFSPGDFHPPFYYLFMSIWAHIFGYSEIALRMPSVIFSLLTGFMVYKIGLLIFERKTAMWATVFFLFNPLIIYYSQEARMYMAATFFLSSTLYFFIKMVKYKHISFIYLSLFTLLSVLTFYGSIFFIGALLLYVIIKKQQKIVFALLIPLLFSLLLLSPLLYYQLQTAKNGLIEVKNWSLVLGKANIKNMLLILIKFTSGRLSWSPKLIYYVVTGFWLLVVGLFVFLGMKKEKLLSYLFILPLLFACIISFFIPMLQYFRFLFLIPVMSLLLANGIFYLNSSVMLNLFQHLFRSRNTWNLSSSVNKFGMTHLPCIVLLIFIIFSFVYLLNPSFHREDWKSLSRSLDSHIPVYMILPSSDPLIYYRKDVVLKEIRMVSQMKQIEKSIYVIPYVTEIYGYRYKSELEKKGCFEKKTTSFRELFLEEWSCGYVAMIK